MNILRTYLSDCKGLIAIVLVLAGIALILMLHDPVIFGKIIDGYTQISGNKTEKENQRYGATMHQVIDESLFENPKNN